MRKAVLGRWRWVVALTFCGCSSFVMHPNAGPEPQQATAAMPPLGDACAPSHSRGLSFCAEPRRLRQTVATLLREPAGQAAKEVAFGVCRKQLKTAGFAVEVEHYPEGRNVVGTLRGVTQPQEYVLLSARYDHHPGCNSVNDPGSGLAALLETARVLGKGRFARTLRIACWDGDADNRHGSRFHAQKVKQRRERLRTAVVLASVGYAVSKPNSQRLPKDFERWFPDAALRLLDQDYRADFLLLAGDDHAAEFAQRYANAATYHKQSLIRLSLTARMLREAHPYRHDQQSFWNEGFAAVLMSDTGPFRRSNHRCRLGPDNQNSIRFRFIEASVKSLVAATADWLGTR